MASSKQAAVAKKRTAQSSKTTNAKSAGAKGTRTTTSRPRSTSARKKKKKVNSAAFNEAALFIALAVALILFISNFGLAGKVGIFFAALQRERTAALRELNLSQHLSEQCSCVHS